MTDGNNDNKPHNSSSLSCTPDHVICPRSHLLPLLLLFLILFVIYFNSFRGAWIFDDYPNIVENQYLHLQSLDWSNIKKTFYGIHGDKISRPLSYLSFGLNYYFHELNVFGYHLVNFSIHCMTALFLYLFIFQLLRLPILNGRFTGRAGSIALLATTLWAINPIQVTAVTVIVQRMASMAGMFYIMAMFFYLMGRTTQEMRKKIIWFCLCLLSGFLALSSKENAVMLPIVLYLFDLLLIQGVTRENIRRHLIMAGIPIVILLILAFILSNPFTYLSGAAYDYRPFTLMERLLTQPRILFFYISLMIYPLADRFTLIYDIPVSTSLFSPWTTMPAILFWVAWIGLSIYLARKRPLVSFCLLFFIVNHVVESSFIPLELVYEHRNYVPSMMLFLLAGVGILAFIRDFSKKQTLTVFSFIALTIIVAVQGHTVFQRNALFEHPLYLWSDNADKSPGLSRVHTNLGQAYDNLGMFEDGHKACLAAIKADRYERPDLRAIPLNNLGNYYVRKGDPAQAMELYKQSMAIDSAYLTARQGMSVALIVSGDLAEAKLLLEQTLAMGPIDTIFLELYSLVLLKQGDYAQSVRQAQKVISIKDKPLLAHKVLGEAYTRIGQYDSAQRHWLAYTNDHPNDMEAILALADLAHKRGDKETARRVARSILFLKGDISWKEFPTHIRNKQIKDYIIPPVFSANPEEVLATIRKTLESELGEK